jgi:hypothetical protein
VGAKPVLPVLFIGHRRCEASGKLLDHPQQWTFKEADGFEAVRREGEVGWCRIDGGRGEESKVLLFRSVGDEGEAVYDDAD